MLNELNAFLAKNNFSKIDIQKLTNDLLLDMSLGLNQENNSINSGSTPVKDLPPADQPMLVVPGKLPSSLPPDSKTIVIDAGGTNFRSCLVSVSSSGQVSISDLEKTKMPAIDKELSKVEFYDAIAKNLDHLKNKANRIGFCFSYAMEINAEGDGKILKFSKEVKAPQAVGTYVGKELKAALIKRGWENIQKISLLNDTTACLLGGFVHSTQNKESFSSYIGFILGTGINNAYIEYNPVPKINDPKDNQSKPHIIVCECGMYNKTSSSTFDTTVDSLSANPKSSLLEKKCSGAYLGQVIYHAVKEACVVNLFSNHFANAFSKLEDIQLYDIDLYFNSSKKARAETKIGTLLNAGTSKDKKLFLELVSVMIERSAAIVASVLSASVLKTTKGTQKNNPVCITANGTTFWKTHGLYKMMCKMLSKNLSGQNKRFYKIIQVENDITLGACAATYL